MFAGGEDRCITAWDSTTGKIVYSIENAHSTRVKGLFIFKDGNSAETSGKFYFVASASSDGIIRVWDTRMNASEKQNPLAEANTKSRLTCLAGSSKNCECSKLLALHMCLFTPIFITFYYAKRGYTFNVFELFLNNFLLC